MSANVSLPLLGPQMDGFAHWLAAKGLSTQSIRNRILRAPCLEEILRDRSIQCLGELSRRNCWNAERDGPPPTRGCPPWFAR